MTGDRTVPPGEKSPAQDTRRAAEASDRERALGEAASKRRQVPVAVAHLRRAVRIARAGLDEQAGRARVVLAGALALRGDFVSADREAGRAALVLQGTELARLTAQRANIHYVRGRLTEALEGYHLALPALRRAGDRWYEAIILANRALVLAHQGAFTQAEADLRRAGTLFDALDESGMTAHVQLNLGWLAARRGDIPSALGWFDRADELFRQAGGTDPAALFDRCEALLVARLASEARRTAIEAVERLGRQGSASLVAEARLRLSEAALLEGDTAAASASAATALRAFRRQKRPSFEALARYASLRAAWMSGDRSPRLVLAARRAADALASSGWVVAALDARLIAAQLALGAGRIEEARRQLAKTRMAHRRGPAHLRSRIWHGVALMRLADGDRAGAEHSPPRRNARARDASGRPGCHRVAGPLVGPCDRPRQSRPTTGRGGQASRTGAGMGRAGRAGSLHLRPVRPPADTELVRDLAALRHVSGELGEAAAAGRDTTRLLSRQAALEEAVRRRARQAPGAGLYRTLAIPSAPMCRAALGSRALVELVACGGVLHAVVVADGRPKLRKLGPMAEAESELHLLRFALRRVAMGHGSPASLKAARVSLAHAAGNLDRLLLEPLEADIAGRDLVLVPTGALHAVPWSLLPSCTGRPVTVAPSAALWYRAEGVARRADSDGGDPKVVLVAGPGLPDAKAEVSELRRSYPDARWLADDAATAEAVLAALDGADLAHVAAHGTFRSDNALFSCLELADGPLTVYDLETLTRAPSTIVLSACDSGLSEVCAGDELMGLAAALFTLGARCLIATVVPVGDVVARPLMVRLHEALRAGLAPAAALADAQGTIDVGASDAVASGGFVCFGAG